MPPSTTHDAPSRNRPAGLRERRSPPRPPGRYGRAEWDTEPFHQMGILVLLTSHGGAISPGAPAFAGIWYWPNSRVKVLTNPPMPRLASSWGPDPTRDWHPCTLVPRLAGRRCPH
jgi:hypothetical protein